MAEVRKPKGDQYKTKALHIRLTESEHEKIKQLASEAGKTISDYCKEKVLKGKGE